MPITISHEAVGPVLQAANLGGYGQHRKEVVRLNQQQQQIDDQYNLAQARLQQQQQQFESTQNMRAYENQQEQQMKMHQQAAEAEQAPKRKLIRLAARLISRERKNCSRKVRTTRRTWRGIPSTRNKRSRRKTWRTEG